MPSCSKVVGLLLEYLEGRLPRATVADLEEHLGRCPTCLVQVRTYRSTVALLHSLSDEDLPSELRTTLGAFLETRTKS